MKNVALAATLLLCACTTARVPRVENLTLDEKIGQLFSYGAHATFMNEGSPAYQQLRRQVRENKVGGIIWFVSPVYETAFITGRLQQEAKVPLLISADLEAGIGMRFSDTTYWPPAMAVAATGDPKFAEQTGRIAAIEGQALGINHILAPVADVNIDPDNPVINARSFGEDPETVAKFVAAFIKGVQSQPVLATAKHFPGHGDMHVDSHRSLPVLDVDRERLERVELVPFKAAIEAKVASVMVGHLAIPALDPTPAPVRRHDASAHENPYTKDEAETTRAGTLPASLSKIMTEGLLRKEMRFEGLIVGDAFDMGALVAHFDPGDAAVRAIEAGTDMILKPGNIDAAIAGVKEAVRSGRLSEARIDESVRRILEAKRSVRMKPATADEIFRRLDTPEHRTMAANIASRAITLVREEPGVLPLKRDANIVMIGVSDFPEVVSSVARAEGEVRRRAKSLTTFSIDARTRLDETNAMVDAAKNADVVVLTLAIRAISGAGRLSLPEAARHFVAQLPAGTNVVAIAFGSPYLLRDLPNLRTYLCAYGVQPVMQVAAVKALFGEHAITGKLPVSIPGLHARGEGLTKLY